MLIDTTPVTQNAQTYMFRSPRDKSKELEFIQKPRTLPKIRRTQVSVAMLNPNVFKSKEDLRIIRKLQRSSADVDEEPHQP